MGKIIPIPLWGILLGLIGFITTIVAYAYTSDNTTQDLDIQENKNKIQVIEKDLGIYATKNYVVEKISDHERLHEEQAKQFIMLTKYLDQRFDDMEKLINKHN